MATLRESDLYAPVKSYLEALGFAVRGEVCKCDAVGVLGDLAIAVELKLTFGLPVLYQALQLLSAVDHVYVAVAVPDGRKARANWDASVPNAVRLCKMLGVGLIAVRDGLVSTLSDPLPYQPKKSSKARKKVLGEFSGRSGDHNVGGTTRRPRVTSYREKALKCADSLKLGESRAPAFVRDATGVEKAATILRGNVYGWFEKESRGLYRLTSSGADALITYSDVLAAQANRTKTATCL